MKRLILLFSAIAILLVRVSGQTIGISYQAVILNPQEQQLPGKNAPGDLLANTEVVIQFTILNENDNTEYQEYHTTFTDAYGMVNLVVGAGVPTNGGSFTDVEWNGKRKVLKVSIDFTNYGSGYVELSSQEIYAIPQPANHQTIKLITVHATQIEELIRLQNEQKLALEAVSGKVGISEEQARIISATSGTNTGDQDISGIATNASAIDDLETEQDTQDAAIA
ncbi:MAG: hypothetical protein JXR10_16960, partial [Cyclobacteriaceae bacterium]